MAMYFFLLLDSDFFFVLAPLQYFDFDFLFFRIPDSFVLIKLFKCSESSYFYFYLVDQCVPFLFESS